MGARVKTVAFQGIEAVPVDVQAQITSGLPVTVVIVGLPDKAIREAGERVRAALLSSGLSLPPKRIVVNLAPADLPKEGSHYDLPIALALMGLIGAVPADALDGYVALGELGLDGRLAPTSGVLPAAIMSRSSRRNRCSRWSIIWAATSSRRGPAPSATRRRRASPISAKCAARRWRGARSNSRPPAATTS